MSSIKEIRKTLEQRKGQLNQIKKDLRETRQSVKETKLNLIYHEQAREILREAGLKTQQTLSYHIGEITSLALDAVFEEPYTLEVDFVERRNKTECDLTFQREGNKVSPLDASGGGAIDVATFALRVSSWSMKNPHTRNVIILDEPLKNLDEIRLEKASKMLKEVSDRLNIQFIIVTHETTLTQFADRVFEVSIRNGVSRIKTTENEPNKYE
jgi:DNA repair exonuclease SbcCD ATPase subunit